MADRGRFRLMSIDELGGPAVTRNPIVFVPAAGLRVVCRHAELVDVPLTRAIAKAHISEEVLATGNAIVSLPQIENLFANLPPKLQRTLFLFDAGHAETPLTDPYYRRLFLGEPTLLATLRRAASLLHRFYNARLTLEFSAGALWFTHEFQNSVGPLKSDAFVLSYLMRLVETLSDRAGIYCGLACSDTELLAQLSEISPPTIKLRRLASGAAVALPVSMLGLPAPDMLDETPDVEDLNEAIAELPKTLVAAVAIIVRSLMPLYRPTIALTAEAAGVSVRTLQRMLDADGVTFKEIVVRERFKLARNWLLSSDMTVSEIAANLGYATPQSFTRAFVYWAGCSPSAFRSQLLRPIRLSASVYSEHLAFRERLSGGLGYVSADMKQRLTGT